MDLDIQKELDDMNAWEETQADTLADDMDVLEHFTVSDVKALHKAGFEIRHYPGWSGFLKQDLGAGTEEAIERTENGFRITFKCACQAQYPASNVAIAALLLGEPETHDQDSCLDAIREEDWLG